MARWTRVFAATSIVGVAVSIWLYLDNRSLRSELAARSENVVEPTKPAAARTPDPWIASAPRSDVARKHSGAAPSLPDQKDETRMERRARRQQEFAAMFGRLDGETEDEYRGRIVPLIKAGLLIPRQQAA